MKIIESPNCWSCLPAAFGMLFGDEDISLFIDRLGHDGSEIIWPSLPEPYQRRAFHIAEMIDVSLERGASITEIEAIPIRMSTSNSGDTYIKSVYYEEECRQRLAAAMTRDVGVLVGRMKDVPHAVAWNGQIYDPNGFVYPYTRMTIMSFFLFRGEKRAEQISQVVNPALLKIDTGYGIDLESLAGF